MSSVRRPMPTLIVKKQGLVHMVCLSDTSQCWFWLLKTRYGACIVSSGHRPMPTLLVKSKVWCTSCAFPDTHQCRFARFKSQGMVHVVCLPDTSRRRLWPATEIILNGPFLRMSKKSVPNVRFGPRIHVWKLNILFSIFFRPATSWKTVSQMAWLKLRIGGFARPWALAARRGQFSGHKAADARIPNDPSLRMSKTNVPNVRFGPRIHAWKISIRISKIFGTPQAEIIFRPQSGRWACSKWSAL